MIHSKVDNKTPNDAKKASAPYFCAYREIVGAEGIPDTITAINSNGVGMDIAANGTNNSGINKSFAIAAFQR